MPTQTPVAVHLIIYRMHPHKSEQQEKIGHVELASYNLNYNYQTFIQKERPYTY